MIVIKRLSKEEVGMGTENRDKLFCHECYKDIPYAVRVGIESNDIVGPYVYHKEMGTWTLTFPSNILNFAKTA